MAELFDADFEKYIVFHRGVSKIGYDNNGALCVYYQDGEIQTLGTPFSEEWQTKIQAAVDAANTFIQRKAELSRYLERAETLFNGFTKVDGINSKTENSKTKYYVAFDDVDGVTFDDESGKYKVITENEIKSMISQIDGVTSDGNGGYKITSANAVSEIKEILNRKIAGLEYDENNDKYRVAFDNIQGITKSGSTYKFDLNDENISNEVKNTVNGFLENISGIIREIDGTRYRINFENYMSEAAESDISSLFQNEG